MLSTLDPRPSTLRAFTLIELLVVISILGLLAALTVPALKNFGKADATIGATRQLIDDVGRARQFAMSRHTTVYMVFVPTNFWENPVYNLPTYYSSTWLPSLTFNQLAALTNLCSRQLTGYTFVTLRSVGDQPGQGVPRYLMPWQKLPDGAFIAVQKFIPALQSFVIPDYSPNVPIYGFTNTAIPFPTEDTTNTLSLPSIAFNYLGQLTTDGQNLADRDEYIPLARGTVSTGVDPATKTPRPTPLTPGDITEVPPGNSTNIYNIVHIDRLTGRAVLEYQKVK